MPTVANECNKAALDGITALLNGGDFRLAATADAELAVLPLQTSGGAFGAATTAAPAVATSNAIGSDASPTPGTIVAFQLRTSGAANRISGTVGTSGADLNVTDNVIPGDATEVTCTGGLQLSLLIS